MITMSKCSIVHYHFFPVVLTQVYSGTASVNPRGLPSNSIGMHLKVLHIV